MPTNEPEGLNNDSKPTTNALVAGAPPRSMVALALLVVLSLAFAVRYINFPHRYEVRDMDETSYLDAGLVMWEGMTPGNRVAPASVEIWTSWLCAGIRSTIATIRPEPAIAAAPWQLRPYLAIDAVLFDIYQDMSGLHRTHLMLEFAIAMGGVYGAFQLGRHYGGIHGAILVGGIVALLPLYVDFSGMTRPYSDAWSFSYLAISSAAVARGKRRSIQTGVFLGLAVSCRIEMLGIVPIVLWQFWENPDPSGTWRSAVKAVVMSVFLVLILAPWFLFQIVGILRTIATTRLMTWAPNPHPRLLTLVDLSWTQGLAPLLILALVAVLLTPSGRRFRQVSLVVFVALLVCSMFSGPNQPMRYHGAPLVAMIALAGISLGHLFRQWPKIASAMVMLALLLPSIQTTRYLILRQSSWIPEDATAWVEQHVPAGTRVYDAVAFDLRCPLPTAESSDALWAQVSDAQSWRKKFERGLARLNSLGTGYIPRALSEDNMVLDRGLWRRYFILGNVARNSRPRYDLQIYHLSPVLYGISDLPMDYAKNGGVIIWREGAPPPELGTPVMKWTNAAGDFTTCIFCSPAIKAKLQ